MARVFIVTGANRGIGLHVGRQIQREITSLQLQDRIIFTTRKMENTVELSDCPNAEWMELDITDQKSVDSFCQQVKEKYNRVDVLVNNAGFAFKTDAIEPREVQAVTTLNMNYYGTKKITRALAPLIQSNGRIVSVASVAGASALREMSPELRDRFTSTLLTEQELDKLVEEYIQACKNSTVTGWPSSSYGISKAAIMAFTSVLSREADSGRLNPNAKDVVVTCCCPGWCKTDMGGWEKPPLTAEQGATIISGLALHGSKNQHNTFVSDQQTFCLNQIPNCD